MTEQVYSGGLPLYHAPYVLVFSWERLAFLIEDDAIPAVWAQPGRWRHRER